MLDVGTAKKWMLLLRLKSPVAVNYKIDISKYYHDKWTVGKDQ